MKKWRTSTTTARSGRFSRRFTKLKLVLEPLESRRLLAGIHVAVYVDQDYSRSYDAAADAAAPNRLVYVDLNKNGGFDMGEPMSTTNNEGVAFFDQLAAGDYAIGLLTNSASQLQSEPSSIATSGVRESATTAEHLLADADLKTVWSIDGSGRLAKVGESTEQEPIHLGGNVIATVVNSDNLAWVIFNSEQGERVGRFDLGSGELTVSSLAGRTGQETLLDLQNANGNLLALLSTPHGNRLARVDQQGTGLRLQPDRFPTSAMEIIGGPDTSTLVAIEGSATEKQLSLLDVDQNFAEFASLPALGDIADVKLSADGELLLVARPSGVHAYKLVDQTLSPIALLAEASAPMTAKSTDGRLVTSNRVNSDELIVWDTTTWQPVGRSQLLEPADGLVSGRRGNVVFGYGRSGVTSVDLSVDELELVSLPGETSVGNVVLGVQLLGENLPPISPEKVVLPATEDSTDTIIPIDLGIEDPEDDELWYSVTVQPRNGSISIAEDGSWIYTPLPNFNGVDEATIRAHDGQSMIEFRLEWIVAPINDPPLSITVDTYILPENSPLGTQAGSVSVLDVDSFADYVITTSDPRFSVENGYIYLSAGGVDFETEPSIAIVVTAVDNTNSSYRIQANATIQISDVNEPPTAIHVTELSVPENELGAVAGTIEVNDPDFAQDYRFEVSDTRFEVVGSTLKLRDDQQVDFEAESVIALRITAIDRGIELFSISTDVAVTVIDRNDPATAILLAGRHVERFVLGSVVGEVTVLDPDNDQYVVTVSDPRFEVVDQTLKLRDDVRLDDQVDPELMLTLTAVATNGDRISDSFAITVSASRSPWQNSRLAEDVNNDGLVSALDILLIINLLNTHGSHRPNNPESGSGESTGIWPDVDGDGLITPMDVLRVINLINHRRAGGEGEGEGSPVVPNQDESPAMQAFPNQSENEWERQKRTNSEIDSELELLLDQLSFEHRRS